MAGNMKDEVQCPICTDTLRKPIRILSCGHNLCHECLVQLVHSFQNASCPTCRAKVTLSSKGLQEIARNHALENIIERMEKVNVSSPRNSAPKSGKPTMNQEAIEQLQNLSKSYQQTNNHQKAVETLQLVIDHVDGWEKLKPSLDLVECLLELGQLKEAAAICDEIFSIADSHQIKDSVKESKSIYDESLKKLILKLKKPQEFHCATKLLKCRHSFVKKVFEKESRFNKFENITSLISEVSQEMSKQNKKEEIKRLYSVLQDIVDDLQKLNDVNLKFKCKQVAWALKHFGCCCLEANDRTKSIILNSAAITLMKTACGEEASLHQVVGHCQNNLGVAYFRSNELEKAKSAYLKAIEVDNTATDWGSEDQKSSNLKRTINNLEIVEKLSQT